MKILVTGSLGFIGRAVGAELANRGIDYVHYDRSLGLDILDSESLAENMAGVSHVIHLAGVLGTAELFDIPHEAVMVNVAGTAAVLTACAKAGAGFVGITMPQVWESLYQATKAGAMALASAYHRHLGVPVSHVRAYNVFGPGQPFGAGHPQKMIPTFANRAYRDEPLPIWGMGQQLVDLVSVNDVARMLVDATGFGSLEVFDAGTGRGMRVLDVARLVQAMTNHFPGVLHEPMRVGEIPGTEVVASGEGWDLLGWHPEFRAADLEETIGSYCPVGVPS